jgi:hypothetical protein
VINEPTLPHLDAPIMSVSPTGFLLIFRKPSTIA